MVETQAHNGGMVTKKRAVPTSRPSVRRAGTASRRTATAKSKKQSAAAAEARARKAAERAATLLAASVDLDTAPDVPSAEDEEIRAMVLGALREVGGREYLVQCARDPRTRNTFLNLCARVGQRTDAALGLWSGTVNISTGVQRG